MSFGRPAVDDVSPAGDWPTRSMLTGMLGCALGYHRHHVDFLARLQSRIAYAVRCDVEPGHMVDLQTARLDAQGMGQAQLTPHGWASFRDDQWLRGNPVMRRREYLTNGDFLVAIALNPADEPPTVDEIAHKLDFPEGVLTIGRRACIPSARLNAGIVEAESLLSALRSRPAKATSLAAVWPESEGETGRVIEVIEDRDWRNDMHGGRRRMRVGRIQIEATT